MHTAKGSGRESSVRGKGRASAGLLQRLLGRPDSAPHEEPHLPGPLAGVSSPAYLEADSVGAHQLPLTRRSLALSSPAETCAAVWGMTLLVLTPAHSPSSGQAAPEPRPAGGTELPHLEAERRAFKVSSLLEGGRGSPAACGSRPAWLDPSAPPVWQNSSSAQRPDLAEFLV